MWKTDYIRMGQQVKSAVNNNQDKLARGDQSGLSKESMKRYEE